MNAGVVVVVVAIVLLGLVLVVVRVRRGDVASRPLRDETPEIRRAVRRAIRDGETDDARIDELARATIEATPTSRWPRYLFAAMVALSILQLVVGPYGRWEIALHVAQLTLWSALLALDTVNRRRLTSYRGLTAKPPLA